jgi:hypothetical protein
VAHNDQVKAALPGHPEDGLGRVAMAHYGLQIYFGLLRLTARRFQEFAILSISKLLLFLYFIDSTGEPG